ncbi:class I SAM-dependent methyltransferase [Clostridium sp. Mt-5]|uniref:Class I SAM-dependent methyltransferase n=1 Tax=Clostridium moutaii TaxID=3240932 RepID=A0ABV4BSK3_9CLOT
MTNSVLKSKPNYGFDGSPFGVTIVCFVGVVCFGGGVTLITFPSLNLKIVAFVLMLCGFLMILVCGSYLYYIKLGKLHRRNKMISMIDWKGNEKVLDIGTGRGLLMIGAAKKLTLGKSIGIDIWNSGDMHSNTYQNTMRNAELEGVLEKVEVRNEDVRSMSFPNDTFDVVLSNLCIHNIPTKDGREKACQEIARVLKPNGTVIITDKSHTKKYGEIFAMEGLTVEFFRLSFDGSLRRIVKAVKK